MTKAKSFSKASKADLASIKPPSAAYLKLIKRFPLRPIESEVHNRIALDILIELQGIEIAKLDKDEIYYMRVLATLIRQFEKATYNLALELKVSPAEMLEALMEQHDMKQTDLVPQVFGTQASVSYALSGKRKLTKNQIAQLAKLFHVSPEVFFYNETGLQPSTRIVAEPLGEYTTRRKLGSGKKKPGRQRK